MSNSISLLIDGKPVTIVFDDFEIAVRIAETLEYYLGAQPAGAQPISHLYATYQLSSYLLAQPLFADISITYPDYRLNLPTHLLCRSLTAMEQVPIQEFHSLAKQIRQPIPFTPPVYAVPSVPFYPPPALPTTYYPPPPSFYTIQVPHSDEQLYKPIQTLFLLCYKNEYYMRDLANFAKVAYNPDKETYIKISSVGASKMFDLPINDRILMIKRMPFEGELKEKVIEILYKYKAESERREREKEKQNYDRHKRTQPTILQQNQLPDSEKIKQVMSVLKQLQPDAISKLLHGYQPYQIVQAKQQGYHMAFKPGLRAVVQDNLCLDAIIRQYLDECEKIKQESQLRLYRDDYVQQHVRSLFSKYNDRHEAIFNELDIYKFHRAFSVQENLLIMLRVRSQFSRKYPLYTMKRLCDETQERLSISIFEKLKTIVEQHKSVQTSQNQPQLAAQKYPEVKRVVQQVPQPVKQIPPPVQQKEKPKMPKLTQPITSYNLTPQHYQILQDVYKAQEQLKQPELYEIQDVTKNFKATVISKVFITILGLGYYYHHLYLLEQNLLDKQIETLKEYLNIDIPNSQMVVLIDILLKSLITFILKQQQEVLPLFTSKQKPQLVKISPQLYAQYEVKEFFFKYQEVCVELRSQRDNGRYFNLLNEECQFIIFERKDLLEMFYDINVFGDLLDAICLGDK